MKFSLESTSQILEQIPLGMILMNMEIASVGVTCMELKVDQSGYGVALTLTWSNSGDKFVKLFIHTEQRVACWDSSERELSAGTSGCSFVVLNREKFDIFYVF